MADEKNMMPELTLEPETATAAAAAVPELTLDPAAPSTPAAPEAAPEKAAAVIDQLRGGAGIDPE